MNYKIIAPQRIECSVKLPASKSIINRVLIINALAHKRASLVDTDLCDDCQVMQHCLTAPVNTINVGAAGTAMRFLTAFFAAQNGRHVIIDGNTRMKQRPIGTLVDALRQMGACIEYVGKTGFPPIKITGKQLTGGNINISGEVSSQFISALLMIAPTAGGMTLNIDGEMISSPYIDMTISVMKNYGIETRQEGKTIVVPAGDYTSCAMPIEGDWSAAAFWYALQALLPQSTIILNGLNDNSIQGDSAIATMMKTLGVETKFEPRHAILSSSTSALPAQISADMTATPDLVQPVAVTLCLLRIPFMLTGLKSLKIKETDRIEGLKQQLSILGYNVHCNDSSIAYDGNHTEPAGDVTVDSMGDHRMAMAMALASTRLKCLTISNAQVVTKSYPRFWEHLKNAGFKIEET